VSGMSGTSVLSSAGKILGVISAAASGDENTKFLGQSQIISQKVAMGTIASCIGPLNAEGSPESCRYVDYFNRTPLMRYAKVFYADYRAVKQDATLVDQLEDEDRLPEHLSFEPTRDSEPGRDFLAHLITNTSLRPLLSPGQESVHRQLVLEHIQLARHPFFPSCVDKDAPDEFTTQLPYLLRDRSTLESFTMNEFGEFSFDQKPNWVDLEVVLKKQQNNEYELTLMSLDAALVERYMDILQDYRSQKRSCIESNSEPPICARADELEALLDEMQEQSLFSQIVWDTQIWLADFENQPAIQLPTCEN
ncbi:MAG: hypothetical protein AAF202_12490, partial [Pseudomonadota bacterium]